MNFIIHTIPVKPDSLDKVKQLFEEKVPPLAEQFSGWRGARLTATDNNQLVTIGMWADKAQMQEFLSQPGFQQAMGALAEYFAGPPTQFITEQVTAVGPVAD